MIGIVGGGLAAAKLVEGYREAGGNDEIEVWSQDPHGPYHRPALSKRLLRGEAEPDDVLIALEASNDATSARRDRVARRRSRPTRS